MVCPFIKRDGSTCGKNAHAAFCYAHSKTVQAQKYSGEQTDEAKPSVKPIKAKTLPAVKQRKPPVEDSDTSEPDEVQKSAAVVKPKVKKSPVKQVTKAVKSVKIEDPPVSARSRVKAKTDPDEALFDEMESAFNNDDDEDDDDAQ